ncbi:unnamed protein product [Strongylus vulgaris]|uniref:Uncharacterized protein n=1 Tax=Strongylus vulgaris TaxID=40348 RepID=A0A3P7IMU3_STRVU|nr:unnamed protein product [Strongylus vulgaris]
MRPRDAEDDWHEFLLDIGSGQTNNDEGRVELQNNILSEGNIVTDDPNEMKGFYERAILAPKNINVNKLNNEAMQRLRIIEQKQKSPARIDSKI